MSRIVMALAFSSAVTLLRTWAPCRAGYAQDAGNPDTPRRTRAGGSGSR